MVALCNPATLVPLREINESFLYKEIGWGPHSGQQRIIDSRARTKVVSAGRRFGKSELGGHRLVTEALNTRLVAKDLEEIGKRREFWIVGPNYTDSEKEFRVLWNRLAALGLDQYYDRPGSYNDPIGGNMHLSLWNGKFQVHGKSAAHPESLVGEGLSGAILAEAAKLKEVIYTRFIRPTLADFTGWCMMTSTPEGKNWFYNMWQRGQDDARPDWESWRMPSWINNHVYRNGDTNEERINRLRVHLKNGAALTPQLIRMLHIDDEIATLVADLTDEAFNQEIGADFTEFTGRVFKEFDEEVHVGNLEYNPRWTTYAAVDYGYTNPSVWLLIQVDPFAEKINVLDEVYESGLAPDEFANEILNRNLCPRDIVSFYPDPASPGDTKILEERLKVRHKGGTGGEIRWRVEAIRRALKTTNPDKTPRLMFDHRCTKTIADMLNYRFPEKKSESNGTENPMKKDDHGPEALGRFFAGRFGTPDRNVRRNRQTRADVAA